MSKDHIKLAEKRDYTEILEKAFRSIWHFSPENEKYFLWKLGTKIVEVLINQGNME